MKNSVKIFISALGIFMSSNLMAANKPVEIQGHRGARSVRPENTLVAFEYAMENNIEVLEMDLSYTKDKVLILSHDEKINPEICLDPSGKKITTDIFVHKLTLAELQKFDCGSLIHPRFPKQMTSKQKMPSFGEVLTLINKQEKVRHKKFKLNVEIKVHNDYIKQNLTRMVTELIAAVKKYKIYDRTTIQSFDIETIDIARAKDPKIQTAFLIEKSMSEVLTALKIKSTQDLIQKYKFNILSPNFKLMTKEQVKALQSQGIQVIVWTVNDPVDWQNVIAMEVDGIITDDPVALRNHLDQVNKAL